MPKPKLLIYSQQLTDCPFFEIIFKIDFITDTVGTTEELKNKIKTYKPDVVIVCFCQAQEKDALELLQLNDITNLVPLIACSPTDSSGFVFASAKYGADYFFHCSGERVQIVNTINKIIKQGGLKKFFEAFYPDSFSFSPYTRKIIEIIISAFPNRLQENEFARQLGITPHWFRTLCIEAFKIKFSKLIRRIWIYQALRLMQLTNFDNTEIALLLNYSEEGSMVRDFRKELGYSPTKARELLANHSPEDMLKN